MKKLKNEQGVALVTSLLLTLISLAIIMAILYMVTQGTKLSAAHKRYKNALEASYGGAEIFTKQILPQVFTNTTTGTLAVQFSANDMRLVSNKCFQAKLGKSTADWGADCGAASKTFDPTATPDISIRLMGTNSQTAFQVFSKIVDTVPGNSDISGFELLDSGSGVTGASSGISPMHIPAMYRIEVQGQKENNAKEKAQLSVLYAY
jgi:Flp pilus assembly pilin Flp